MRLQFFNRFTPSEHFDITLFGITFFEFSVITTFETTICLTLLGVKLQLDLKRKEEK